MRRQGVRVLPALLAAVAIAALVAAPAYGQIDPPEPIDTDEFGPKPMAMLFLIEGASFEELLSVPEFRQLARGGGAGLLSIRTTDDDEGLGRWVTIGAGARSWGPVTFEPETGPIVDDVAGAIPMSVPMDDLIAENAGRSVPGLLRSVLSRNGLLTDLISADALGAAPRGALVAMDREGMVALAGFDSDLLVYEADPVRLAEAMGSSRADAMALLGHEIGDLLGGGEVAAPALAIVASPTTTPAMDQDRDELPGIVMSQTAGPGPLLRANGPMGTLTSATTRRNGLVSNEDIAPTILTFFGIEPPAEMHGSPIEIVREAPPFALHRTYVAARGLWAPVQGVAGIAILVIAALVAWCLRARGRGSARAGVVGLWLCLTVPALLVALLAAGSIPSPTAWSVVAFLIAVTLGLPTAAMLLGWRRGPLVPGAIVGGAILIYFLIEGLFGFPSTMFTYIGGTALEGGRYYGLPNVELGLLLGSALFVAAVIRPYAGFVLLIAVGLFAGLPSLGSDHGGIVTIFFAAGLWLALGGRWKRIGWKGLAIGLGFALLGAVVVFAADAWLAASPTHGTRFLQSQGVGGVPEGLLRRLGIGVGLLADNPVGIVYLLLTPVLLWWLLRAREGSRLRTSVQRFPRWGAAIAVLLASSIVAYVVNDTGVAAVGLGFAMAVVGLASVSLATGPERMSG